MGMAYKGGSLTHRSLRENMSSVRDSKLFQQSGNHFGSSSKNGASVTVIRSGNPLKTAQAFFDKIGYGGEFMMDPKNGQFTFNRVRMRDGTVINFRVQSKSGSPAVDINITQSSDNCGLRSHKIHFIK